MYNNDKTSKGVGRVLTTIFILFIIVMIGILGTTVLSHIDGDTMTITTGSDDNEECGDEQAQQAMKDAGLRAPVKCKKNK